jgi:hypothetical protein
MDYTVRTVTDGRPLKEFFRLPYRIYRENPHWTPPLMAEIRRVLDVRKNPYFAAASLDLFLCSWGKQTLARASLVINEEHCRRFHERAAFFGFFESVDDEECAKSLFAALERRCRERGVVRLEGPFNPNHYSELGLLADQYDGDQGFFETYNPRYYHRLLSSAGFAQDVCLFTGRNNAIGHYLRDRYGPPPEYHRGGEYRVRNVDLPHMAHDLESIRDVFNDAFAGNWHFLPATAAEHLFAAKYLHLITRPALVTIVEHRGLPVGALLCVLDVNPLLRRMNGTAGPLNYCRFLAGRMRIRTLVVYAVGIRKAYQGTRVFTLLMDSIRRTAGSFDVLTCTWMHPGNALSCRTAARVGLVPDKHFTIYSKQVSP